LTQSGYERLTIAAVQTNPESHCRAMAASKVRSLALPKYRWPPIIDKPGTDGECRANALEVLDLLKLYRRL
jgi:hypothetical protein